MKQFKFTYLFATVSYVWCFAPSVIGEKFEIIDNDSVDETINLLDNRIFNFKLANNLLGGSDWPSGGGGGGGGGGGSGSGATSSVNSINEINFIENDESNNFLTLNKMENSINKSKIDLLSVVFKKSISKIKAKYKKIDITFLIDSSSSVGKLNFLSEIKFVQKLLSDLNVSYNSTRVAVITFGSQGKVIRHIDQISAPTPDNDKCKLLNIEVPKIQFHGGGTYTYGALEKAKETFDAIEREDNKKIVFLITDGFSNGRDPVPMARILKNNNVAIFTIGIQNGNYKELYDIASTPGDEYTFLLDSFSQFESLARKALHSDYKIGTNVRVTNQSRCDLLCDDVVAENSIIRDINSSYCCDKNAECVCGTTSGHYSCMCQPGFYGSGLQHTCELCPNGTYWQSWNLCRPCPDINHITIKTPAISIDDCVCKNGFKTGDPNRCQVITCPKLNPPESGYFVKHPTGCGNVLNAACGARCKSGYQLSGSSIRLCQENGTWSGVEPKCVLKTCPPIPISYYGTAKCKNSDLDVTFDYTFKNSTFADEYENDTLRITEPLPIDTECKFECGPGFYLVGSPTRNCLPLSKWDGLPTTCKQILCAPLPKIPFGDYDPTDCDHQKQAHSTNCSLACLSGFDARGPVNKYCGGKRSGVWTHKLKTPKCVDVTPPKMNCPENYEIPLEPTENYALVTSLRPPEVTDNSGMNVTFWTKPSIKDDGIKLSMGMHNFTYVAVDSFKNKVRCNFTVTVVDKNPPVMEYCIDPPPFAISLSPNADKNDSFIHWDDPIIYDNSNGQIQVSQSLQYGFLDIGVHKVNYTAIDEYGNSNSCVLNISVIELRCNKLDSPQNGQTICAQNKTHMWCEVNCNFGFGIHLENDNDHLEQLSLVCDHETPRWGYDYVPDCAAITLPNSVQEVFSLSLDSDTAICDDIGVLGTIQDTLKSQVHEIMCSGQKECEVVSDVAFCNPEEYSPLDSDLNEKRKTYYNIVKREIRSENAKVKSHLKINIYTKVSKELGYWNASISRSENIKFLKEELRNIEHNDKLQQQLANLNIELKSVKHDLKIKCKDGSVFKRQYCLQCPSGTFHNKTMNICQSCPVASFNQLPGQVQCKRCPQHFSTKRMNSKTVESCREQCRPGTTARLKVPKNNRPNQQLQKSMMPFCKKCNPGEYQQFYDQTHCVKCPDGYSSPRGSRLLSDCKPKMIKFCLENPSICGPNGRCVQESSNSHLYSCMCKEGYIGAHCEKQVNSCLSAPCVNGGICKQFGIDFLCLCPKGFNGQYCENNLDPCSDHLCANNGNCIEVIGKPHCECQIGYTGEFCEVPINHCQSSPCENGECVSMESGFQCKCDPGFIGRRCHLRPCDYLPCSEVASCIDVPDYPTTKSSYVCVCSKGLKGFYCNVIDNPCDRNPCRNNGVCVPKKLRQLNEDPNPKKLPEDEEDYTKYKCDCPPFFYGNFCEIFIRPDYILSFEKSSVNDYVQISGPRQNLREISFCVWLQTSDSFNYGVILSYASQKSDNMFTFTDYNGFVLYVDGNHVITDITINDGLWHFICVTWTSENGFYEIYLDGKLHDTGFNLSTDSYIQANGSITIGQEQDDIGTSFSETEAFVGKIAYLDIWNYTLPAQMIQEYFMTCEPYLGNLVPWTDFKINIHGNVKVLSSPFCRLCPTNLFIENGQVDVFENKALYVCHDGYMIKGLAIRQCLRTSQWELPVPYCQPITCGTVRSPMNGYAKRIRTIKGDEIIYSCDDGYDLMGVRNRQCLANGTWSETSPQCVSKVFCNMLHINNSEIIYATDSGPLNRSQLHYPVGTMGEVHCLHDTLLSGENLLFCTENGWDVALPTCYTDEPTTTTTTTTRATTTITTTSTTTTTTEAPPDEDFIFWNEIISKVVAMNYPIDIDFLQNLREYYFYGCTSDNSPKLSVFCYNKKLTSKNLTDLTDFNTPITEEFYNIDEKWLEFLITNIQVIMQDETKYRLNITSESLLDLLIYNRNDSRKFTESIEDTFRLYFCFYIDSLILDHKFEIHDIHDYNNLEKIQLLIKYLIFPFWPEYTVKKNSNLLNENYNVAEENTTPIVTTSTTVEVKNCKMAQLNIDVELFMAELSDDDGVTTFMVNDLMETHVFSVNDVLTLACIANYVYAGDTAITCMDDGNWSSSNASCTKVMCSTPNKPTNMIIEDVQAKYEIGSKVALKCKRGYSIHGNAHIECLETAKWSRIFARCLKISCNKPKLPANTSIVSGRSFLYLDKLKIACPNQNEMEIECSEDGKWMPQNVCK